ncbi:MAG: metallophosphoesterase family protein [Novosphingobium sp.]
MIASLRQLFSAPAAPPRSAVPADERVYAVGDIHGRSDLFEALIAAIEADDAAREAAKTTVVLLGDLVDRGPDSAGVIALARGWAARRKVRLIAGNHEEMFLASFTDRETLKHFLKYGGRETVLSYPMNRDAWNAADIAEAQRLMDAIVPAADREFLAAAEDMVRIGDYLFVHAGIAPGVPFDEQRTSELRWIREPFLSHRGDHGAVVVHGHTITKAPVLRANRIGLDTGAYQSGRLTALGLEGARRWLLEAAEQDGAIATTAKDIA